MKRNWDGWRANMIGAGGMLLLLLKHYPEERNVECLILKKNQKMFQIDLSSDLKKKPDLKSRCYFTLFEPIMSGS